MKFIQIICTCSNESQNHDLFWKLFPVLLSLSLTFILFYLSRIFDDHIKGKEVERNWYLKIVVDSNNKIIQDFFEEMVNEILKKNNTISDLLANLSNENKTYSKLKEKALFLEKFKKRKRKFELEFGKLLEINFPDLAEDIYNLLRDLEDDYCVFIDNEDYSIDKINEIENSILTTKGKLFLKLFEPVKYKKPDFLSLVS
jgi:hypothetical protein